MITLVSDTLGLMPSDAPNVLVLSEIKDYVPGYERILYAIEDSIDLTVYVRNTTIEHWLKNMASRYPHGKFEFKTMDARSYLEQKWETSIPDDVSNEDIVASGIMEADITPRKGDSFENIILEYFFDHAFTTTFFSAAKIVEIVNSYEKALWEKNFEMNLPYMVYQKRLNEWRRKVKSKDELAIINMVESDIPALKNGLIQYKILRHYKEIGLNILGKLHNIFSTLKPNLHDLEFEEKEISTVIQQIEYYLNELEEPDSIESFSTYIRNLSGILILEFDKVESILKKRPDLVTPRTSGELKVIFHPIHNLIGKRLQKIDSLMKPDEPSKPDLSWSFDEMMEWATRNYLPYFVWADKNEQIDDQLLETSDRYAEWLYSNWEELRANSKRIVYNILPNYFDDFKSSATKNLMIIIDNLGWRYAAFLKDFFQNSGYGLVQMKPYISMLPSSTEISKKCMLAGSPNYNEIDNTHYTAIVEKGWVPFFDDSTFHYLSNYKKLEQISNVEHQTYVVNYLPIDPALHKKESELGIPHDEHIITLLSYLIASIFEFIEKHNLQNDITIHITSDHGSTKIPETLNNGIDIGDFKKLGFQEISYRYAAAETELFNSLPDNLKEDCFYLKKETFGTNYNYLCARKGNRFSSTDGSHYVHGGLSPEETIVPYLQFRKIIATIKHLTIQLKQTTYRYRLETVTFEIANPNEYPVEDITLDIINSNIESKPYTLDWLEAKRKASTSMQMRFKKTQHKDDTNNIRCSVFYTCNGKEHRTEEIRLPITLKSMIELKDPSIFDDWD
ncbi:hypothetical protein ACFL7M_07660 [Thermodesulfobacteriota bacterium]